MRMEDDMNGEGADWSVEPEPADDERVLHGRAGTERDGRGTTDYAEAVTTRDAAWWTALSDYERGYGLLRALESACERGAPLHLARCVHHLHDLLSGLDPADRAWVIALLRRIQDLLAHRTRGDDTEVTLTALLAYLSDVRADPRFAPSPALPVGLLHRMYPRGVRPEDLQEALDRHRYPRGKPLPACPLCEPDRADPSDPLAQAVAALPTEQRVLLVHLGQVLALDGDAPDLAEQLAWVTGTLPVPASYHAALARACRGSDDTLAHALDAEEQP
jgi:hypothetical protein